MELTTPRIITMEYCPSVKISDVEKIEAMGLDRAKLAERSAISYLEQVAKCERNGEWGVRGGGREGERWLNVRARVGRCQGGSGKGEREKARVRKAGKAAKRQTSFNTDRQTDRHIHGSRRCKAN